MLTARMLSNASCFFMLHSIYRILQHVRVSDTGLLKPELQFLVANHLVQCPGQATHCRFIVAISELHSFNILALRPSIVCYKINYHILDPKEYGKIFVQN